MYYFVLSLQLYVAMMYLHYSCNKGSMNWPWIHRLWEYILVLVWLGSYPNNYGWWCWCVCEITKQKKRAFSRQDLLPGASSNRGEEMLSQNRHHQYWLALCSWEKRVHDISDRIHSLCNSGADQKDQLVKQVALGKKHVGIYQRMQIDTFRT